MVRIDEAVFGYYRGRVEQNDASKLVSILIRLGICSDISSDGTFILRKRDYGRFVKYAKPKIRYTLDGPYGLYGFLYQNRQRYGLFLSMVVFCFVLYFSGGLVWDVRISGNEQLDELSVEEALSECGFGIGSFWHKIDKNYIEAEVLSQNPDIAWISVNRRGTVAYVQIIESENINKNKDYEPLYSNLIAEYDGVIEAITVESGRAVVKVGDVVKKGDILISGVVETDRGVVFCRASGEVRAQCVRDISVITQRSISEKVYEKQSIAHVKLILFNFSVNIFKNYRNSADDCDIIKEINRLSFFNRCRLPVSVEKTYLHHYTEVDRDRTDDEMIINAKNEMTELLYSDFKDSDIIKLRSNGKFIDGAFMLTTTVVYSTDIGKEIALEIN